MPEVFPGLRAGVEDDGWLDPLIDSLPEMLAGRSAPLILGSGGESPLSDAIEVRGIGTVVLVPVIAALSYEAIRFAGFHLDRAAVRWLFTPNIALQYLTTRVPDDEQIQVAIASLQRAVEEDARAGGTPERPSAG